MSAIEIQCPVCGLEPGKKCRTLTTNRSTDTHMARIDARYRQVRLHRPVYPND